MKINKKIKKTIYTFIFSIIFLIMLFSNSLFVSPKTNNNSTHKIEYTILRNKLYNEINNYITPITNNHNLDIYKIIDLCIKNEYNIGFLLTQAQLESHFGTKGEATKTNSMFNVIWCNFDDKNDSIEPYIDLMKRKYLSDGRTYKDLLNNFIDIHGNRYAEALNYERNLKSIYIKISNNTNILSLYKELQFKTSPNSRYFL